MNPRAIAANIISNLVATQNQRSPLNELLWENNAIKKLAPQDKALLQELCYGTARWYYQLHALLRPLLSKPLKEKDHDIYHLLLIGLYQLFHTKIAAHTLVMETVEAAVQLKKPWA